MLWLFLSSIAVPFASGEVFYVHPNDDSSLCPANESCYSLYEYESRIGFMNNSVYYFLSGTHQLNESVLVVNGKNNVTFQGQGVMTEGPHVNVMESPVIIRCIDNETTDIQFIMCDTLMLLNITIKNCTLNISESIDVTFNFMSVQESLTLYLTDVINGTIYHSSFFKNYAQFEFNDNSHSDSLADGEFVMNQCNFTYGLSVFILKQEYFLVDIQFISVRMINGEMSASIILQSNTSQYNLYVCDLMSFGGNGLVLLHEATSDVHTPMIRIQDSIISQSSFVALVLGWFSSTSGIFRIDSSIFQDSVGGYGFGSALQIVSDQGRENLQIILHNTTFKNNSYESILDGYGEISSVAVTVGILNARNFMISNCTFSNNEGSGLGLINTIVTFRGQNNFINNRGYSGGGIYMASGSYLYLTSDANLSFINNYANTTGGAINVGQTVINFSIAFSVAFSDSAKYFTSCFYQFVDGSQSKHFYFNSNTAETAGSVIYGGSVGNCFLENRNLDEPTDFFLAISTFVNQSGYSLISSEPRGVCFCIDSEPDCSLSNMARSASPGENVKFSVALIGQYNNLTTGVIKSFTGSRSSDTQLQEVSSAACIIITHTIELDDLHNQVSISVTPNSFESNFYQPPKTVIVQIKPCPPGFCLVKTQHNRLVCGIDFDPLKSAVNNYNIANGSVSKNRTIWLEGINVNCNSLVATKCLNDCSVLVSSQLCPFDYCNESTQFFSLAKPDEQCSNNRTGRLCGNCSDSMSLMLGSNKCGQCSNAYLTLIIPFGLFGIILVILIIALNLTVTAGTVNGLLFFANAIKIYQPLVTHFDTIKVLSHFISWINMDFGIETCFYDGMESCGKTALQFVFPVYLLILLVLIIVLSRWFSKFARLIGNNAVPVLCTLLLLSFTKLLRTTFSILSFVHVVNYSRTENKENHSSILVWFVDGSHNYSKGCHLPLFIIALLVLIFVIVPYVSFLFFPLWEQCRSKWNKGSTLYLKLKPFFDAYAGPHTEAFRCWPGILLLARIVLAITVTVGDAAGEAGDVVSQSMLIAVVIVLITVLSFGVTYKNSKLHSLDIFYFICLLTFSVYLPSKSENDKGIIVVLAFGFLVFLGILAYHTYKSENVKNVFVKVYKGIKKHDNEINDAVEDTDQKKVQYPTSSVLTIKWSKLRESLLEM